MHAFPTLLQTSKRSYSLNKNSRNVFLILKNYYSSEPPARPFATMRQCHEGIRGGMKDITTALENNDFNLTKNEINSLFRTIDLHMKQENDNFFPFLDTTFDEAAKKAGFYEEHDKDHIDQANIMNKLNNGEFDEAKKEILNWIEHHEKHLVGEEEIMMPLTMKVKGGFKNSCQIVNSIINVNWNEFKDHLFGYCVEKMNKHNPYPSLKTYVFAVQASTTKEEFDQLVPILKEKLPEDVLNKLMNEDGLLNEDNDRVVL